MSKVAVDAPPRNDLYDQDFYAWTQQQAQLLRERRWDELDLENLAEEVRSVGGSEKGQIRNRLVKLIAHLLKWKYQPGARSSNWGGTIREQRRGIKDVIRHSPSLRRYPQQVFSDQYLGARLEASAETGVDFTLFPEEPPFTAEQALDDDFLPKEPDLYDQS